MIKIKNRVILTVLAVFVCLPFAYAATGAGDKIPHDLSALDQNGTQQSFDTFKGEQGVVVFVRSADWCPFCQKQLIELNDNSKKITERGYTIATVSYDSVETLAAFSQKHSIQYKMLSDLRSQIIQAFGILNTDFPKGTRYYGVP